MIQTFIKPSLQSRFAHFLDRLSIRIKRNNPNFIKESELRIIYKPCPYNTVIRPGENAANHFRTIWNTDLITVQEQVYVIFVGEGNVIRGFRNLFTGTGNECHFDTKLLFGIACQMLASGIVIAHNHPSGRLQPSEMDIKITKNIIKLCKLHNIGLVDHIILTKNSYFSFVESKILSETTA